MDPEAAPSVDPVGPVVALPCRVKGLGVSGLGFWSLGFRVEEFRVEEFRV